jgi:hypothetical protein
MRRWRKKYHTHDFTILCQSCMLYDELFFSRLLSIPRATIDNYRQQIINRLRWTVGEVYLAKGNKKQM